jgi:lipopolysaccharide/colanic/teichoic acid biosynthesis glycosyltransferase
MRHNAYANIAKRFLDWSIAATLLFVLSPIVVALAVIVRWRLGSPILFWQRRPGLHGRVFWMPKFRTMTNDCDSAGELLSDEKRLTRFGRFLRSTSLDELPELWSVLRGEMSLVGPRPLLPQYLELYTPEQMRRHCVKPGITGLAQVSGRNAISWEQKFDCDLEYVDDVSLRLDIKILAKTFVCVFRRNGISAGSHITMPVFTGTNCADQRRSSNAA